MLRNSLFSLTRAGKDTDVRSKDHALKLLDILVGKGHRTLYRHGSKWEDNIKMDPVYFKCGHMNWFPGTWVANQWRFVVNGAVVDNLLTAGGTVLVDSKGI